MALIQGGQLLFPRDSAFHLFYNCDLMVKNGQQYSGKGTIDYVSQDEKKQPIYMTDITVGDQGFSVAKGEIAADANFTLNEAFGFAGKAQADAQHQHLYFEGGVRLLHKCSPIDQLGLLAYANYLDPEDIRVEVPETPVDWKGQPISASLRMSNTGLKPVSGFLTKDQSGTSLMSSHGLLHYDASSSTYTLTSQEKLVDPEFVDRFLKLNTDNCVIEGEGPISFGLGEGAPDDAAKLRAYGTVYYDPENEKDFLMTTVLGVTFPIDEGLLTQMAKQIEDDLRPSPSDRDNDLLNRALLFDMGDPDGELAYQTYRSQGAFDKLEGFLNNTILLENLRWEYSATRGYAASGTTALCNVGKTQLHVNVRYRAQLFKRGSDIHFILYLQIANDHWYYFNYDYRTHHLSISSSVGEWNDRIVGIKKDKRTGDNFSYSLTNSRNEIQNFLSGFTGEPVDEEEEELEEE
jgi:hypothetical protein